MVLAALARRRLHAGPAAGAGRPRLRRHRRVRRGGGRLVRADGRRRPSRRLAARSPGSALRAAAPSLRYGENPHQAAALYTDPAAPAGLAQAEQLHGKEMSYNNYVDADAAWRAANDFADQPAVAIIKHANPCGIAVGADVAEAHRKAHACDPVSAFGGVIAVNRPVSVELAKQIAEIFTEVVVAPDFEPGAVEILPRKKNIRLLRAPAWQPPPAEWRQVTRRRAGADGRPDRRRRRRPGHLAAGHRRGGRRGRPCATWPSPGGRSAR